MASIEIAASAARTTTGQSAALPAGYSEKISMIVDVTAVTGTTPSCTFSLEWSHDGSTWFLADPADTFVALTAAGKRTKSFDTKADFVRLVWTISGTTPSFTFSARLFQKS